MQGRTAKQLLLATACLLMWVTTSLGATYYIDHDNGNDSTGTGTIGSPWKSMTKAEAEADGGDTVIMRAGTYPRFTWNRNHSRTDYLTFKAYSGEYVKINGGLGLSYDKNQWNPHELECWLAFEGLHIYRHDYRIKIINCRGVRYVKFKDCEIWGRTETDNDIPDGDSGRGIGIDAYLARDIYIDGCDIHDTGIGVYFLAYDSELTNSKVHHVVQDCVKVVNCNNILIEDCEFYQAEDPTWHWHCDAIHIHSTISLDGASWLRHASNNVTIRRVRTWDIRHQSVISNGNKEIIGKGFSTPYADNLLIENCLFEDSIDVAGTANEINVERHTNITIRNVTAPGIKYGQNSSFRMSNTICKTVYQAGSSTSLYNDYNLISDAAQEDFVPGSNSIVGIYGFKKLFTDYDNGDLSLMPNCPAIDAGTSTDAPQYDMVGNRRWDTRGVANTGGPTSPVTWDMGALEYQGTFGFNGEAPATITETHSNLGTGSGIVTITSPGNFEFVMKESQGGRIAEFYDLTEDPGKTRNLGKDDTTVYGLWDSRYLSSEIAVHKNQGTTRSLEVVHVDDMRVVVKCSGTLTTNMPFEVLYTFYPPNYQATYVDVVMHLTNNTGSTVSTSDTKHYTRVANDPSGYIYDWEAELGDNNGDRYMQVMTGSSCNVPNVAVGRYIRVCEKGLSGLTTGYDDTPVAVYFSAASRNIAPGETLVDHFYLRSNLAASPTLYVDDNLSSDGYVSVYCPNYFELIFDEDAGGGIREFYDLRVDPLAQTNFAETEIHDYALFDMKHKDATTQIHKGRHGWNDVSLVTTQDDEVVVRVTGKQNVGGQLVDFTCDYSITPPTSTGTSWDIDLTLDNNTGSTVPSGDDVAYLQVRPNFGGDSFNWQSSNGDSSGNDYWIKATVGSSATIDPVTPGLFFKLTEKSYGTKQGGDNGAPLMSMRFGAASQSNGTSVTRSFILETNIQHDP